MNTTVLAVPGQITSTALSLPQDLEYDGWEHMLRGLRNVGQSMMWWLGDALLYGEAAYGEAWTQAADVSGYSIKTLRQAMWVSRSVKPSVRREHLSWTHHVLVAGLTEEKQAEWLKRAEEQSWSVSELREALRPPKTIEQSKLLSPGVQCVRCGAQHPEPCHYTGLASEVLKRGAQVHDLATAQLCQSCHDFFLANPHEESACVEFLVCVLNTCIERLESGVLRC